MKIEPGMIFINSKARETDPEWVQAFIEWTKREFARCGTELKEVEIKADECN